MPHPTRGDGIQSLRLGMGDYQWHYQAITGTADVLTQAKHEEVRYRVHQSLTNVCRQMRPRQGV